MISEPFINRLTGKIEWFHLADAYVGSGPPEPSLWRAFADFEREKLVELGEDGEVAHISTTRYEGGYGNCAAYSIFFKPKNEKGNDPAKYDSAGLIGYPNRLYFQDCESSRLLKRAEFLKAVCEKEEVEWLPKIPKMEPMLYCTCEESRDPECSVHKKPERDACADEQDEIERLDQRYFTKGEVMEMMKEQEEKSDKHLQWLVDRYSRFLDFKERYANEREEEREWRKALLDVLTRELQYVTPQDKVFNPILFQDLRRRFLS